MRRSFLLLPLLLLLGLGACGFQLRGAYPLPFETLAITLPEESELYAVLKRAIVAGSSARVVTSPEQAQATLIVLADNQAKNILSITAAGRAREFQLVRSFAFRVTNKEGRDWLPASQIILRRDVSFNDDLVLSKESEEALLWRDIQNDLVQQVLRRLAAAKSPV